MAETIEEREQPTRAAGVAGVVFVVLFVLR